MKDDISKDCVFAYSRWASGSNKGTKERKLASESQQVNCIGELCYVRPPTLRKNRNTRSIQQMQRVKMKMNFGGLCIVPSISRWASGSIKGKS
ncbi:hypothetical protein TNCT_167001 [Trichonephila clavata]|uniref:Uncharacterized protein n=1 Tax=Trichonephila clavata TaxID=2740835 RepID=A0A8X6GXQ5_TRICU|nr:hypothetical protein TNCT_167001 [Trichonephila clavata]